MKSKALKEFGIITFSITVMSSCNYFFNIPNNFCFGGINGLSIVLSKVIGFSPVTITAVLNVFLLILGFIILGKGFGVKTAYASLLFSAELSVLEKLVPFTGTLTSQPMLEVLFAITIPSVGAAMLFNIQASSGGSDIIAMILKKYTSIKDIGKSLMICDSFVVISCFFVFGIEAGLFSVLGLVIKTFMVDSVIDSFHLCKYFTIITTKPVEICDYITQELGRGATQMNAKGYYTEEDKTVIFTVLTKRQAAKLQFKVKNIDSSAFMMITNTSEIIGKGFRDVV